ncbi:er to golgi transport-related protein [Phaffia rhodozyma]|uniref:Er to golgi transport-related protein n=1 Tax=Phaffia rhodozyma TaxID=264483 RepID=A0A0F7SEU6_PHARH|nr:er to golgi transport-related protein [Phaffia rhodozyma]
MVLSIRVSILLLSFLAFASFARAIKFDLKAELYPSSKCIWNYANAHSLVIVTTNVGPGPQQRVDIEIRDGSHNGNIYLAKKNIQGETRLAITTHENAEVGVCFKNYLDQKAPPQFNYIKTIDLETDIGAEATDFNAIANQESLSTLEVEMRKLEGVVKEIVDELAYLQRREAIMRNTNESSNQRIQYFSLLTLCTLLGLGVWQILHLRSFFKRKYLID